LSNAMKYKADASKAGPERADKKANCANCQKYNKCSAADTACKPGAKDAAYAPCEIFAGKVVAKNGWCMSWTKA
ncbi:high-potential iron-sulfur protein, partial [bacterium]|nr:high-potential iron-sulfur protein [bacterium]